MLKANKIVVVFFSAISLSWTLSPFMSNINILERYQHSWAISPFFSNVKQVVTFLGPSINDVSQFLRLADTSLTLCPIKMGILLTRHRNHITPINSRTKEKNTFFGLRMCFYCYVIKRSIYQLICNPIVPEFTHGFLLLSSYRTMRNYKINSSDVYLTFTCITYVVLLSENLTKTGLVLHFVYNILLFVVDSHMIETMPCKMEKIK